ncbi:hypothetical protein [Actinoplanes palleronii]|uniref:TetR family transcriptional regulator n=1 Tax=Actinoplanes palleronii TaxID=113570 RepID=A0ABQ4BGK7_9ACTN|nr:hypothetical protein [Actinoplanes palleronii]GIE69818.1 hypothetical protein Apa02nite_059260 [Actinoplanes palleronii]
MQIESEREDVLRHAYAAVATHHAPTLTAALERLDADDPEEALRLSGAVLLLAISATVGEPDDPAARQRAADALAARISTRHGDWLGLPDPAQVAGALSATLGFGQPPLIGPAAYGLVLISATAEMLEQLAESRGVAWPDVLDDLLDLIEQPA